MTIHATECLLKLHDQHHELEDYQSGVPRWCTGCGDNAILAAVQRLCRDEDLRPEKTMFVSGIGCSSRFPHYMKTYGFHGIHGRALPVAEGIKMARPDLDVFVTLDSGVVNSPANLAQVMQRMQGVAEVFQQGKGFPLQIVHELDVIAPAVKANLKATPFIPLE